MSDSHTGLPVDPLLRHAKSRAANRGPVDDMKQLTRIMIALMPTTGRFLPPSAAAVSEQHIKEYFQEVLGPDAPRPEWGLPDGWGAYLADLFSWAAGSAISKHDAMRCVYRAPGRAWEVIHKRLHRLGLFPAMWEHPLKKADVALVNAEAVKHVEVLPEEDEKFQETVMDPIELEAFPTQVLQNSVQGGFLDGSIEYSRNRPDWILYLSNESPRCIVMLEIIARREKMRSDMPVSRSAAPPPGSGTPLLASHHQAMQAAMTIAKGPGGAAALQAFMQSESHPPRTGGSAGS